MTRLPYQMQKTARRDKWNQQVRKHAVQEGRAKKDAETRRMEEYRRLCKKEGITSQRLQDYDEQREVTKEKLQSALDSVDNDSHMTNAQKRRRKFALKQKASSRSVTQQLRANKPMERLARKQAEAKRQKEEQLAEREQLRQERDTKVAVRQQRQELYQQRTRKGQPVMKSRIQALLQKLN